MLFITIYYLIEFHNSNFYYEPSYSYQIDKTKSYLFDIGLISEDNQIIESFKQFSKSYKNLNLSHFNEESEINDFNQFTGIIEIKNINNTYQVNIKRHKINFFNNIIRRYLKLPSSNTIVNYLTNITNGFLLNYTNNTNSKDFNFYPIILSESEYTLNFIPAYFLGGFFIVIYGMFFFSFSLRMIDEREKKLDSLLNRYGIQKYQYFFSWFLTYIYLTLFSTFSCILCLFVTSFKYINFMFIFVVFSHILYSIGIFSMAFFIQSIIKSIKTGQLLFRILFIAITIIGNFIIFTPTLPKSLKVLMCIFPHLSEYIALIIIGCENKFGRTQFGKLECIIYQIIDIAFYTFGGFFVMEYQESGVGLCEYILSLCSERKRIIIQTEPINSNFEFDYAHEELNETNLLYQEQKHMLEIKNITKSYNDLVAVDNFCCELFPNEIFCLLGHNGAGKSTLIKMISGLENPNNGDIFLNNISLITNKKYLYRNIGLCSQDDIFFDYLTVEQHLRYMAEIKGTETSIDELKNLLVKIDLMSKKDAECSTLSGGQKRKLCIALALIGNSQLILLDEPTSGLDVVAKKALWNFLKNYKQNKIIILTTHSLDEAEYLGDRIGIMSEGHFLCSGTSSFLKDKYQCGYNINIILNPKKFNQENKKNVITEIKNIYPDIKIKNFSKTILSISSETIDDRLKDIFNYIDNVKEEMGIEDYTISTTSLEDVFIKLNVSDQTKNMDEIKLSEGLEIQDNPEDLHNETSSFCTQLYSNIQRNLIQFKRNKMSFTFELFSSLIIIIIIGIFGLVYKISEKETFTKSSKINKIYFNKQIINNLNESIFIEKKKLSFKIIDSPIIYKNNIISNYLLSDFKSIRNVSNNNMKIFIYENNTNVMFLFIYDKNYDYYNNFMISLSSSIYLKSFRINSIIFNEYFNNSKKPKLKSSHPDDFLLFNCVFYFTFISFSGYTLSTIVKEKERNIKHLLYLSGNNMYCYWLGFFVVDIIKYLILVIFSFTIMSSINEFYFPYCLRILPVFIAFCFTMTMFLYFFSFFISKEENAQKSFFILLFLFLIGLPLGLLIGIGLLVNKIKIENKFEKILKYFYQPYFITIAEISPMTSLIMALIRISYSYAQYDTEYDYEYELIPKPFALVITHCIYFIVEFFIWGLLIHLCEIGYLTNLWNKFLKSYCLNKDYEFSTEVPINDGFIIQENLPNFNTSHNNNPYNTNNNTTENINNNNSNIINNESEIDLNNELDINSNSGNQPLLNNNNTNINININNNTDININNNNNNKVLQNKFIQEQILKVNNNIDLTTKIVGLTKTFCLCCKKNLRAVNNLYLGLDANEKFGLLGYNGSGKSTIFKCITNELFYDSGEITLFGYNNNTSFDKIRTMIGYCPQENPLFDYLTVRELLTFYKSLKRSKVSIEDTCSKFGIEKYIDKYCVDLSGGNKRKLTFAIALMNYPKILLLDEPSTGVDPQSRRIMWKNINELSLTGNQYNMILSTHSMEEAEILCDTVSWLRSGNFVCVGNPEKLKLLYSSGYKTHIKFKDNKIKDIINNNDINYQHKNLCDLKIEGSDFIMSVIDKYQNLGFYVDALYNILSLISDKCLKIAVTEIGKDFSFELKIHVKKDKQGLLFSQILNMKLTNDLIAEISINMESLENVLIQV